MDTPMIHPSKPCPECKGIGKDDTLLNECLYCGGEGYVIDITKLDAAQRESLRETLEFDLQIAKDVAEADGSPVLPNWAYGIQSLLDDLADLEGVE